MGKIFTYGGIGGTPNGVLYERYRFRMVYEAVCKSNAKLESMIKNKDWSWSPAWSEKWWEFKANWLWFPLEMLIY
jgi:hypothetical protein